MSRVACRLVSCFTAVYFCTVVYWKNALGLGGVLAAVPRVAPGNKKLLRHHIPNPASLSSSTSLIASCSCYFQKSPLGRCMSRDDFSHDAKRHFASSLSQSKSGASPGRLFRSESPGIFLSARLRSPKDSKMSRRRRRLVSSCLVADPLCEGRSWAAKKTR